MSNKEKPVELTPVPPTGWKVKHGTNMGSSPGNYPKVEFAKGSGGHLVIFELKDAGAVKPTFNAQDPIWIKDGSKPTGPGIDAQISDWAILDGGKTLVILDSNSKEADLHYVIKANGYATPLDPIIRNGGSTSPPPQIPTFDWATAGIALLAGLLIGFIVHKLFFANAPAK